MGDTRIRLTLYVTPQVSGEALAHLYKALSIVSYSAYELELVDIQKDAQRALKDGVDSAPLLICHTATGDKRIEKLADTAQLRTQLGLKWQ